MKFNSRMIKACSFLCAALFGLCLILSVNWSFSQQRATAAGNIRINTNCVGITSTGTYDGKWKRLGPHKAKCLEGANGSPGAWISRLTCRIVTINDGKFDNATIIPPTQCVK